MFHSEDPRTHHLNSTIFAIPAFPHIYPLTHRSSHLSNSSQSKLHLTNIIIIQILFLNLTAALKAGCYIPILQIGNLRLREVEYLS